MNPGTPFSLILMAAGGILVWGIDDRVDAVNLGAIGVILILVGALGLVMSLAFWSTIFGGNRNRAVYSDDGPSTTVVRDRPTVVVDRRPNEVVREPGETVYVDEEPRRTVRRD
jgi:hypothetical protein